MGIDRSGRWDLMGMGTSSRRHSDGVSESAAPVPPPKGQIPQDKSRAEGSLGTALIAPVPPPRPDLSLHRQGPSLRGLGTGILPHPLPPCPPLPF